MLTRITGAVARRGALGLIGPAPRLRAGRGRHAVARAGLAVAVSAALTLAASAGPALATASRHAHPVTGTGPGSGWSIAPTPNPLARTGQLIGVSCASSTSCTAVGDFTSGSGVVVTLAEHGDGGKWAIQPTPNPLGARLSALISVSCSSPSACTAVGQAVSNQGASRPLAERWNGTQWRIQATPNPSAGGGALFGVACTSPSACAAVGASNSGTLAERWNGTKWRIVPSPSPSAGGGALFGVACTSPSACTAVGASNSGTLAEQWNSTKWAIQPTPNPSGAQFSFLNAVSCTSSSACTAVGGYGNSSGNIVSLAERWDSTRWRIQPTPNPPIPSYAFHLTALNAVSCTSASACTTVGGSMSSLSTPVTLAEQWNGTTWAIQSTPDHAGAAASGLFNVACTSPRSCIAVGGTSSPNDIGGFLTERWNGTRWRVLPTPTLPPGGFSGVSCTSPASCTAVGQTSNAAGTFITLAERWNGTAWRIQPTPNPGGAPGSGLGGVSCPTEAFCMATGASGLSTPSPSPLAEAWNGTTWRILHMPAPAGAQGVIIGSVSCTSPSACTTTGSSVDSSGLATTLAERWNGKVWRIQPTPNPPGAQGAALGGVACTGPSACLAVGNTGPPTPNNKTLAERWDGVTWRIVPSANPAGGGGGFNTLSCASASACTAVGLAVSNSGAQTSLAERWNGTRWSIQATPNPAVAFQISLDGVACPARRWCTAVGDYGVIGTGAERVTLGLQWRGTMQRLQGSSARSRLGSKCAGFPAAHSSLAAGCGCAWPLRATSARWLNPAQPWHWSPARLLPGRTSPAWPSPLRGCPPL